MVGREAELETLRAAFEAAQAGRGGVVLVAAEAGVGKSRLVQEAGVTARAGRGCVLTGRAAEGQSTTSLKPLAEALFTAFRTTGPPATEELAPYRAALGHLVPEWRSGGDRSGAEFPVVLAEGILRLLRLLAGPAGCVLVLEDLHWADADTLAVLDYLSDNLASEPVLCLGTLRTDEGSAALRLAADLSARRTALVVELTTLESGQTAEMATACLGGGALPARLSQELWTWSEGVPFLVEEVLAAWIASGALRPGEAGWSLDPDMTPEVPASFADTVGRRVASMGADARPVLAAAAALGRSFDWRLLSAGTTLDERVVLEALRRGVANHLLAVETVDGDDGFCFRHALTRDAVLGDLLPPERVAVFTGVLLAVESTHGELPGTWCEKAAELAQIAGRPAHAARLLLQAGRRALKQGALPSAEDALERARVLAVDDGALAVDIDETLVAVLALEGRAARALDVGRGLLAEGAGGPVLNAARRAEVLLMLARALLAGGDFGAAGDHLEAARGLARDGTTGDEGAALGAAIDAVAAHVALGEGRLQETVMLANSSLDAVEPNKQAEVACEALEALGRCARLRDFRAAEAFFEQALEMAEGGGLTVWSIRARHELALLDMLIRLRPERLLSVRRLSYEAGALATAANLDLHIAAVHAFHLDARRGLAAAHRCSDSARRLRLTRLLPMAMVRLGECHAVAGERRAMEVAIAQALRYGPDDADVQAGIWGQCRAVNSLLAEHRGRALVQLDTAMEAVRGRANANPWVFRGLWVLVHAVEDDDAEATQGEFEASGVIARPLHRAYLGLARAVTHGRRGRLEEAEETFAWAHAEMVEAGGGGPGRLPGRLVAEAAIKDGWGRPVTWLGDALGFFEGTGHRPVAAACRSLLRQAGAPVPRRRPGPATMPAPLASLHVTAREAEILSLIGAGLRNDEIAARLYLSTRTVHKHMQHLRAKTGLVERDQLASLAACLENDDDGGYAP